MRERALVGVFSGSRDVVQNENLWKRVSKHIDRWQRPSSGSHMEVRSLHQRHATQQTRVVGPREDVVELLDEMDREEERWRGRKR